MRFHRRNIILAFLMLFMASKAAHATNFLDQNIIRKMSRIPRLDARKALALYQMNKIILVDTHENVRKGHKSLIMGAITLPYPQIKKVRLKFPRNKIIACF